MAIVCGVGAGVGAGVGVGAGAVTTGGLMEGVLKENAESAEGVSEGGLEAKEKGEPKGVDPPREKAGVAEVAQVDGTVKVKPDADDETGAVGTMLNGAAEEEAAGAGGVDAAAEARPRFGNVAGPDGMEAATLGSWTAKEPVNRK